MKTIAISSGKGGVGKSTITTNLAAALTKQGYKVGVLDADIYGPSQPIMFGIPKNTKIESQDNKFFIPINKYGIELNSIGFLIDEETALAWRGPMASKALQQLYFQTIWSRDLDYLLIDLPPGTGDIQLTMVQKIPVDGAIIITTPQDVALKDVERAYNLFQKTDIKVLGVIENMSFYTCPHCNNHDHIFGQGAADKIAENYKLPIMSSIPLNKQYQEDVDAGMPTLISEDSKAELIKPYIDIVDMINKILVN